MTCYMSAWQSDLDSKFKKTDFESRTSLEPGEKIP